MKKHLQIPISILFLILFISFSAFCQEKSQFNTDVETDLKPWTNLNFYNDPSNFQFAIVADNTGGSRPGVFEKGVEKLNMMMPEFVLSVGDLIQGYTQDTSRIREEWDDFNNKVEKLKMPFFYLPGNHDITNLVMQKEWENRYGRRYYHFSYKGVLFIILDSNDDEDHNLTDKQTNFAIEAINENPDARWTFVLMHHPIWKYDTDGKFEKIEDALKSRKHTVIAGHEHHYQYIERKKSNYYVLGTTGAGSALRGEKFGEMDHIVWMTMTDNGPVMANLKLDGILSHDVTNATTIKMAGAMLSNTNSQYFLLTNPGEDFKDGTAYLHFNNTSEVTLNVYLSFYHHHQVDILPSKERVKLMPGEEKVIEITLSAHQLTKYNELGYLRYYWKFSYEGKEYEDFFLDGNSDFSIAASTPNYFKPQTPQFVESAKITFDHPYDLLKTQMTINGKKSESLKENLQLNESTRLEAILTNDKNQSSASALKSYELINYLKGTKVKKAVPGLSYSYYEGKWHGVPDFSTDTPIKKGVTNDFSVGDIAINKDNFGIQFTGFIEIFEEGMYYFRCRADDIASLKIHGKIICLDGTTAVIGNENKQVGPVGAIALSKGMHPIEINYYEIQGGERLRFYHKRSEEEDWNFLELNDFFRTTKTKK